MQPELAPASHTMLGRSSSFLPFAGEPPMADASTAADLAGAWQGLNHVSLVTGDLDATVAFYRDVLQMRVVFEAPANPHHGRHAMISPGGAGMGLHFFELASAQIFRFPD